MRHLSFAVSLFVFVLLAVSCSHKSKEKELRKENFPLIQKYSTGAGDVFYFRPRDGQFVLVERRKALAVAIAPEPNVEAFSFDDRITVSRKMQEGDALENKAFLENIGAQQALAITRSGHTLAGGDAQGVLNLWSLVDGSLQLQSNRKSAIQKLAFAPNGDFLAVGLAQPVSDPSDTLWIYDINSNGPRHSFGHNSVQALAWSTDSHWYAAGLDDGSILLGELDSTMEPRRVAVSTSAVVALSFHPTGLLLASAHADKRILISKVPMGEPIFTFEPPLPPNPLFPRGIEQVTFDDTGARLAVSYAEGDMRIWDTSALSAPN
jgi:WD40 repeat protein